MRPVVVLLLMTLGGYAQYVLAARKGAEEALRESEERFRKIFDHSNDAIFVVDPAHDEILNVNTKACAILGYSREEMLSMPMSAIHPDEMPQFRAFARSVMEHGSGWTNELACLTKTHQALPAEISASVAEIAGRSCIIALIRDISERKRAEEALREQARRDPLTGVLNHGAIVEELRDLLSKGGDGTSHAVAMIDVDGLKAVNDTYGHQAGDAVLTTVAGVLSTDGTIAGRYGGDEFVAVLTGANRAAAERYREGVLRNLSATSLTDPETGTSITVSASIGLAVFPEEAETIDDLIRLSDSAMYASRQQRPVGAGGLTPARPFGGNGTVEMVGQIVPLLTSPGQLEDKLRLVSQRICVGAGYDAVNIDIFDQAGETTRARHTFSDVPDEVVETWRSHRRRIEEEPILQETRRTRRALIVGDPQNDERLTDVQRGVLRAAELRSAVVAPLFWGDEMIGAISAASKREAAFTPGDAEFLMAVADQVTAIVRMANLVEELQTTSSRLARSQEETVLLLAAAAEAHDHTTGLHLHSVRGLTEALASELGYSDDHARELALAAVLHDIGKIRVPESVLASTGELTEKEWELMKHHTTWGAQFLADRPSFDLAATIARSHHERCDGGGYPDGLSGEAIPEAATIVAVADSFDAMTHDRPYKAGRSIDDAVREIAACSGKQFSPRVVDALEHLYQRNALPLVPAPAPIRRPPRDRLSRAAR